MLQSLLDSLSDAGTGAVIAALAGLLAILGAVIASAKAAWPSVLGVLTRSGHAITVSWSRLSLPTRWTCARLRWNVLFGGHEALLETASRSRKFLNDSEGERALLDLAKALAFSGKIDAATSISFGGAAWGLALERGPQEALSLVEPRKEIDSSALFAWEGLAGVIRGFDSRKSELDWCRSSAMTNPIAAIADELDKAGKLGDWPSCLEDAGRYLLSKPGLVMGWVPVRDVEILRPIDRRRLRALRRFSARASPCVSLPRIAANLAILVRAEARYSRHAAA